MVEAVFDLSSRETLLAKLEEMGLALDQGLLILNRQVSAKGESRAYGNGSRLTMAQLRKVGDLLVDLHGQHDHQSLLRPEEHLNLLDGYGGYHSLKGQIREEHEKLALLRQELQDLARINQERRERQELFQFQLREIEDVEPAEGEDEELEVQRRVLENVEQLFAGASSAYENLFEEENSIIQRLAMVRQILDGLGKIDDALNNHAQECAAMLYQLEDLSAGLRQYAQKLHRDPERLTEIQERLQALQHLKRKYGGSLSGVLKRKGELAAELDSLMTADERLENLTEQSSQAEERFSQSCQRLSSARKEAALRFQKEVERELEILGMAKTRFQVQMKQIEDEHGWAQLSGKRFRADATGMDQVEFFLSPNPGEGLRPLAKIASGGEISRIMLAMKGILAQVDQVPLLVFDEIDVGIGGEVAEAVGQALKALTTSHQVLCITHLHQIACLADEHLLVRKEQREGRTVTMIKNLSSKERVREIARMMGGERITQITLDHAQEMIESQGRPGVSPQ